MAAPAPTSDWYAVARRRAVAAGRRRRAEKASVEWPDFAPPVALSDGPLGAVQAADREIARQTALGPTSAGNLTGYCTTDHRGKHQAPGWTHRLGPDGTLTVTTPTGLVAVTTPPPY